MRAISLWQPWATAIAVGVKKIETRRWYTAYSGPLAIHAAKRWGAEEKAFAFDEMQAGRLPNNIPLGCIVATCVLHACRPTEETGPLIGEIERIYGNYEAGRFAWFLVDVVTLPEPIPFRGAQGFFNVPDELLARHL